MLIVPSTHFSGLVRGPMSPLGSVLSSTIADLDATIATSYTSGQTWANFEGSPADSSSQSDNDFFLGVDGNPSTDDPSHVGPVGSASARFDLDGGDLWKSKVFTDFIKSIHKTTGGSDFWFTNCFRWVADSGQTLFGTTNNQTSNPGVRMSVLANNLPIFVHTSGISRNDASSTEALIGGVDYLLTVTHSHSGDVTDFYINQASVESVAHNFDTGTTDAAFNMHIAARGDAGQKMINGTRVYSFAYGNEYLDSTKAAIIRTHLIARHERTYITP